VFSDIFSTQEILSKSLPHITSQDFGFSFNFLFISIASLFISSILFLEISSVLFLILLYSNFNLFNCSCNCFFFSAQVVAFSLFQAIDQTLVLISVFNSLNFFNFSKGLVKSSFKISFFKFSTVSVL